MVIFTIFIIKSCFWVITTFAISNATLDSNSTGSVLCISENDTITLTLRELVDFEDIGVNIVVKNITDYLRNIVMHEVI